jgi:predicted O-methyltransferase YrrM
MANNRRRGVRHAAKERLRAYLNAQHPERAALLRARMLELRRFRSVEDRIASLERATFRGVASDDSIHDWEVSIHSQNGEDGILMHVFSRIGATSRRFLEFGCGTGLECNSANLALGFGWSGLLLDANETHIVKARTFFDDRLGDDSARVGTRSLFVTPDNINDLLDEVTPRGGSLDLLSIDVDSIDYWIWDAVEDRFRPRVVVCEYNAAFGPSRSVTVSPREGFDPFDVHPSGYYHGVSLAALHKLGASRDYQLIGVDSAGVNAFFVQRESAGQLPDLEPAQAFRPNAWRSDPADPEAQFRLIAHLPVTEV